MANVNFTHVRDHAVVVFDGDLDWDAARELVESLDTVVGDYFYTVVELVVSSPGGKIGALQYVLDRLEQLEAQGVQVRTRVLSSAGSAAAIIVALGHERVAEPDAILSFHCAQLSGNNEINAQSTAAIHSVLNELDGRMVGRLVGRVLGTADAERLPHQAERSDRRVLALVAGSLGRSGRRKLPRKVRGLARAVGEFEFSPYRPGLAGVVRVRPVSTLVAGEAYIALSDERFERRQLQPFVGATPGPEKAPARPVALLEGPDQEGGRG